MPKHTPRKESRLACAMGDEVDRIAPAMMLSSRHSTHFPGTVHGTPFKRHVASHHHPFHVDVPRDTFVVSVLAADFISRIDISPIRTTRAITSDEVRVWVAVPTAANFKHTETCINRRSGSLIEAVGTVRMCSLLFVHRLSPSTLRKMCFGQSPNWIHLREWAASENSPN